MKLPTIDCGRRDADHSKTLQTASCRLSIKPDLYDCSTPRYRSDWVRLMLMDYLKAGIRNYVYGTAFQVAVCALSHPAAVSTEG